MGRMKSWVYVTLPDGRGSETGWRGLLGSACVWTLLACTVASAAVTRVELVDRADVLDGAAFGTAGPYERIVAKVYFAVDPSSAANKIIVDAGLASRNEQGLVEFAADLYVLKPRDPKTGNGTALVEISNRGGKGLLPTFNFATQEQPYGDRFLLEQGFTLVWIGWEWDVPPLSNLLRLYTPIITDNGKPITGLVRAQWTGDARVLSFSLGDRNQLAYPVANRGDAKATLTVRDHAGDAAKLISRDKWSFADDTHVTMPGGFDPGKIYEVVYTARDPVVAGLGPAAVRDFVSFLKFGGPETLLSDQRNYIKRALGFGISQSGRFLRSFVYDGFNQDEQSRRVFDGVWAHVAGAGRGSFNARFAQPSRDGHPFMNLFYPVDIPPFTDDGLLEKARAANVAPKVFFSNGSYEYWGRCASLIHTTEDGKKDAALGPDTRVYFFAGAQHGPGAVPPRKVEAQNLADTNDYRPAMRALLAAMQAWLKDGTEPPESRYPLLAQDQLVTVGTFAFPHLTGIAVPRRKREAYRLDFATEPPKAGEAYLTLVPRVNSDGNETSGIRMPEISAPLASYTGWNLRKASIGAPDELFSMVGSWIPFPVNRTERENAKDPRTSIEERYASKREYLEKITLAAQALKNDGFLLERDIPWVRERAAREWDYVLTSK
jgi:hypothetical protein